MSIRVLLADDHPIFTEGLRSLLGEAPDLEVVGEARCGREAVELAQREKPDVVVMDVSMPGMNGMEATRQIRAELPEVRVLALSMHSHEHFVEAVLKAGAAGYLLKECAGEELAQALRAVSQGQAYLSPGIAGTVLRGYTENANVEPSVFSTLTGREREVLQLLAEGHSTQEQAERLGVSPKTIASHREHLMEKLDIHSIAGLTKFAIREGVTSAEE